MATASDSFGSASTYSIPAEGLHGLGVFYLDEALLPEALARLEAWLGDPNGPATLDLSDPGLPLVLVRD